MNAKQLVFFVLPICLAMSSMAQVNENFSDGDFTQNPVWEGETANFVVNASKQLQLNSAGEGSSWLSTQNSIATESEWSFWIRLAFSASSNNMARVYLLSDQKNLNGPLNGYFLQFGEAGSNDAIELFRQQGLNTYSVCRGVPGFIASSFAISVKVIRTADGLWKLFADPGGSSVYQFQVEGMDNTIIQTGWFGWLCKYTSSNSTKFYLDNILVGPIIADTIPPKLLSVEIGELNQLILMFNEPLDGVSASDPWNYSVNHNIGYPQTAIYEATSPLKVTLGFSQSFTPGLNYRLTVREMGDQSGNKAFDLFKDFSVYDARRYDILMTEIMADPDPVVGLPNYEYLELFNRSEYTLRCKGWQLKLGNTVKILPDFELTSGSYSIICRPEAVPELSPFSACIPLTSFQITNAGQSLQLYNAQGLLIHEVSFSDSWYRNSQKKNGGWSLEMIDPMAVCLGQENWIASEDASGGSPGMLNSVNAPLAMEPSAIMAFTTSDSSLHILFNQNMDVQSLENVNGYSVQPTHGSPVFTEIVNSSAVIIHFNQPWIQGVEYQLSFNLGIVNCMGLPIKPGLVLPFRKTQSPSTHDILITEIMADPDPVVGLPAFEYIELYNTADYPVNLQSWRLLIGSSTLRFGQIVLQPKTYMILGHQNAASAFSPYGSFYGFSSFSLSNTGVAIALYSSGGNLIHSVTYSPDRYYPSAKANGGWSLEMADISNPCSSLNWMASVHPYGGTPGAENSVKGSFSDNEPPIALRVLVNNPLSITLVLNESCDSLSLINPSVFRIEPGLSTVNLAKPIGYGFNEVDLTLNTPLETGIVYKLVISAGILDCAGNSTKNEQIIEFGLPEVCLTNDVVINEILTNPPFNASDYLELYNRSSKVIELSFLALTYQSLTSVSGPKTIFLPSNLLMPGKYYCLTRKPGDILKYYHTESMANFVLVADLPDFTSDSAFLYVHSRENNLEVIDQLKYSIKMHHPLLKNLDGVSLERVNYDVSSALPGNWQSASEQCGYGTPAMKNSQYMEQVIPKGHISIEPEIFSPDGDGRDDVLQIRIIAPDAGFLSNIRIYESSGRLVKMLGQNLGIGSETTIFWDGIGDSRQKLPMGMYVVMVELFHSDGRREYHKAAVAIGCHM